MRALNIIKTSLNLWLQRHHQKVFATCMILVAITMLMDTSLYLQRNLINWRVQKMKPLDLHVLFLSLAVGVTFHIGYQHMERYFPYRWMDLFVETLRRMKFAGFIVRRLLYQLQLASQRLPKKETDIDLMDPAIQQIFQQVQKEAYEAVHLFRRDANAILDRKEPCYIVLEEEDEELRKAGFSDLEVPAQLLRQLLSPYGEGPSSSA